LAFSFSFIDHIPEYVTYREPAIKTVRVTAIYTLLWRVSRSEGVIAYLAAIVAGAFFLDFDHEVYYLRKLLLERVNCR
jgi:hypothetical protein